MSFNTTGESYSPYATAIRVTDFQLLYDPTAQAMRRSTPPAPADWWRCDHCGAAVPNEVERQWGLKVKMLACPQCGGPKP